MQKDRKKLIHKLRFTYRLVLINDETFEEKFSFKLTPINVFAGISSFIVLFSILIIFSIFYTPLREYVPGYTDTQTKRNIGRLLYQTDSLERALNAKEDYLRNMLDIMHGGTGLSDSAAVPANPGKTNYESEPSQKEKDFRKSYEASISKKDDYSILKPKEAQQSGFRNLYLVNPAEGIVSSRFNLAENHFAVDIVTRANEPVKSVQEGTVIFASWTPETGNTLAIQHKNNLVSIYKHNAALLKKVGTFVSTGEIVAIVGNTGEFSSGPHLHFELWDNGSPVNPEEILNLN
jgi:murein DD-endopeptidase MepM/ murein hydrolase activator NlpD